MAAIQRHSQIAFALCSSSKYSCERASVFAFIFIICDSISPKRQSLCGMIDIIITNDYMPLVSIELFYWFSWCQIAIQRRDKIDVKTTKFSVKRQLIHFYGQMSDIKCRQQWFSWWFFVCINVRILCMQFCVYIQHIRMW